VASLNLSLRSLHPAPRSRQKMILFGSQLRKASPAILSLGFRTLALKGTPETLNHCWKPKVQDAAPCQCPASVSTQLTGLRAEMAGYRAEPDGAVSSPSHRSMKENADRLRRTPPEPLAASPENTASELVEKNSRLSVP